LKTEPGMFRITRSAAAEPREASSYARHSSRTGNFALFGVVRGGLSGYCRIRTIRQ